MWWRVKKLQMWFRQLNRSHSLTTTEITPFPKPSYVSPANLGCFWPLNFDKNVFAVFAIWMSVNFGATVVSLVWVIAGGIAVSK
jgi:hypothetical protein